MGIAILSNSNHKISSTEACASRSSNITNNSMSQDFIFTSFSNGADHQIRRDKLQQHQSLVGLEEDQYETAGMLSEMFNFPHTPAAAAELLDHQRRLQQQQAAGEWYGNRSGGGFRVQGSVLGDSKNHDNNSSSGADSIAHAQAQAHQISGINADSAAAAMQLFLMNPQPTRSSSPPQPQPQTTSSSTLHMLLPNPSAHIPLQGYAAHPPAAFDGHVINPWIEGANPNSNPTQIQGHGLSLSLSSSLQAKVDDFRMGDGGLLYYNQPVSAGAGGSSSYHSYNNKILAGLGQNPVHVGFGSSVGVVNVLRSSKYVKPAQELLEEFCSVGRGHLKKNRLSRNNNPSVAGSCSSSSVVSKDVPPLSAADRIEHQRRKVKLLSMLDEVDRRYNHYCEQMQMVVNSFDLVMGFGAAVPYTALAQKAMSRHFRCLKDTVTAQVKQSCEVLGEKDVGGVGVTKGETPRLKLLEQSLRQQRAFHQMGMMDQEAWRPQRGLPERSVNILRAWLFEHFLHPYPSDADKHLLARQTGLSRNQVSNWFINARVRLWKPMVEDMYQQEAKEEDDADPSQPMRSDQRSQNPTTRSEISVPDSDPSVVAINTRQSCFSENQAVAPPASQSFPAVQDPNLLLRGTTPLRMGTTAAGDVSLTLGLRHAGNVSAAAPFSVTDFGA